MLISVWLGSAAACGCACGPGRGYRSLSPPGQHLTPASPSPPAPPRRPCPPSRRDAAPAAHGPLPLLAAEPRGGRARADKHVRGAVACARLPAPPPPRLSSPHAARHLYGRSCGGRARRILQVEACKNHITITSHAARHWHAPLHPSYAPRPFHTIPAVSALRLLLSRAALPISIPRLPAPPPPPPRPRPQADRSPAPVRPAGVHGGGVRAHLPLRPRLGGHQPRSAGPAVAPAGPPAT
jgi:hypothetical protein